MLMKSRNVFFYVLQIFPLGIAVLMAVYLLVFADYKTLEHFLVNCQGAELQNRAASFCIVMMFICFVLWQYTTDRIKIMRGVFWIGAAARLLFFVVYASVLIPASDQKYIWRIINGERGWLLDYYTYFSVAYTRWAALWKPFVDCFHIPYLVIVGVLCFCGFLTVICVYQLAYELTKNEKIALLSGILYGFNLNELIHTVVVNQGKLSLLMFMITFIMLGKGIKKQYSRETVGYIVVAALCLGVGNAYKPIGIVIIIAYMIMSLYDLKEIVWYKSVGIGILMLLSMMCVTKIVHVGAERVLDIEINDSSMTHFLCIGLNTEGEGRIDLGSKSRYYDQLRGEGLSEEEATKATYEMLREDWRENSDKIPKLFWLKFRNEWQDETEGAKFFIWEVNEDLIDRDSCNKLQWFIIKVAGKYGQASSQWYYIFYMVCACIGVGYGRKYLNNSLFFLISLYTFGYTLLILITESNKRYKNMTVPVLCIMAALGIQKVEEYSKQYIKERKKSMS